MYHDGMTNNDQDFEVCFRVDNVVLPKSGYFGVSASTSALAGKKNPTTKENKQAKAQCYKTICRLKLHRKMVF
jgi:Legume-like lectin family